MEIRMDSPEYLRERITQLEWEIEKLLDGKLRKEIKLEKLRDVFDPKEIEWRVQRSGSNARGVWAIIVPYLNARTIIDRLDSTVGPDNWQDSYAEIKSGFLCTLSILTDNGWVPKTDGAELTDIEGTKGGISDAFKRAAVKWGIGRYLYDFDVTYAEIVERDAPGAHWAKTKEGKDFYWRVPRPKLPQTSEKKAALKTEEPPPFEPDLGWTNKRS
jgi:hypothetical protein